MHQNFKKTRTQNTILTTILSAMVGSFFKKCIVVSLGTKIKIVFALHSSLYTKSKTKFYSCYKINSDCWWIFKIK